MDIHIVSQSPTMYVLPTTDSTYLEKLQMSIIGLLCVHSDWLESNCVLFCGLLYMTI